MGNAGRRRVRGRLDGADTGWRALPLSHVSGHGRAGPKPLVRLFERHLWSKHRCECMIATYLIGLCQADAFLPVHGTTIKRLDGAVAGGKAGRLPRQKGIARSSARS
jgi:hypothetical protein